MNGTKKPLGVLFADIADSTHLYKTYGDERARELVLNSLNEVRSVVESCSGRVVERIGDELMCTFPSAGSTATAAIEIQVALHRAQQSSRLPTEVNLRVAFHFGPVLLDDESIFGETVYTAKRVASLAKAEQILTTLETARELGPEWRALLRFVNRTTIKGKEETFEVHEVIWDESRLTVDVIGKTASSNHDGELILTHHRGENRLGESKPVFTIGRGKRCDYVVGHQSVSRLQARIEYRKGKFFLTDVSRNGTVVEDELGNRHLVHRDELRLLGEGLIHLGDDDEALEEYILRYRCHSGESKR